MKVNEGWKEGGKQQKPVSHSLGWGLLAHPADAFPKTPGGDIMPNKVNINKALEIIASLFLERQEISQVVDGKKTVVGYTEPKTIIFDSDMVNVSKIPGNALGYFKREKGKTVLRLVEIHPPSLVEKLLRGK